MNNQKDNHMDFVPEISIEDKIEPSLTTIHTKNIEKALVDAINYEMKQLGNTDVEISNIRLFITDDKRFALADVSYIWWLRGCGERLNRKNMVFAIPDIIDGQAQFSDIDKKENKNMMSLEKDEEYQMHVEIEAESIVEDVRDYAKHHHYQTNLFFDDVVKLVEKLIDKEKER